MKKIVKTAILLAAVAILAVIVVNRDYVSNETLQSAPSQKEGPKRVCESFAEELFDRACPDGADEATVFCSSIVSDASWKIENVRLLSDISATCDAILYLPDTEKLLLKANELIYPKLETAVQNAASSSEIYNASMEYHQDFLNDVLSEILPDLLSVPEEFITPHDFSISLKMLDGEWQVTDDTGAAAAVDEALSTYKNPDEAFGSFQQRLFSSLEYIGKEYAPIDELAVEGFVPNPSLYGKTDSIEEIKALVSSPQALKLIGEEKLSWSENIQLAPDTKLRYYLDDTILVLVWNELHGRFTETFSEVFIADASQFRRKLTDDTYHSETLLTVQTLSEQTNAVLAESGDMSGRRNRDIGIFVYNREIFRFEPDSGDTCYIASDGDMLFSHRHELSNREDAEKYIDSNDILFSLCFGPVMIENGTLAVPGSYPWGEAYEKYMRNVLGQIGKRHYLIYNSDFMTVYEAAETMLQRGCISAYALDGGFTACTVLNNSRINPVVGEERPVSDIIYYVTAVPDENQG